MQTSVSELIRVVSDTIEKLVIPELPRASWASGYLHSALAVLAALESRTRLERGVLAEDHDGLTALLLEARILLANVAEAAEVAARLDETLGAAPLDMATADTDALGARREAYSQALNVLIEWTYANKAGACAAQAPRLLELFADYREGHVRRSAALLGDAPGRAIF